MFLSERLLFPSVPPSCRLVLCCVSSVFVSCGLVVSRFGIFLSVQFMRRFQGRLTLRRSAIPSDLGLRMNCEISLPTSKALHQTNSHSKREPFTPMQLNGRMVRNRFLLVDCNNLIFRSHFAHSARPLVNSKGVNVSIPFQCVRTIAQLLRQTQATHVACIFDARDASAG
jgi:hypothetical protein